MSVERSAGGIDELILTQRDPGSAGVRVDPEGQPREDDDKQSRSVNAHHVEADLSPQGEDDLHTCVVACARNETTVSHMSQSVEQAELFNIRYLNWISCESQFFRRLTKILGGFTLNKVKYDFTLFSIF